MDHIVNCLKFDDVRGRATYSTSLSKGRHQGQRKLNVMEVLFLKKYSRPGDNVLYVGAAPGIHIVALADQFPTLNFVLFDPLPFDKRLSTKTNVEIHNCFFTHETAKDFIGIPNSLFVCDIRGSDYFGGTSSGENDKIIQRDMGMQMDWTVMLGARHSMLKFKPLCPGSDGGPTFTYLDGLLLFQPFAKLGSSEMRLIVDDPCVRKVYDKLNISKRAAFYNQRIRSIGRDVAIEKEIFSI